LKYQKIRTYGPAKVKKSWQRPNGYDAVTYPYKADNANKSSGWNQQSRFEIIQHGNSASIFMQRIINLQNRLMYCSISEYQIFKRHVAVVSE